MYGVLSPLLAFWVLTLIGRWLDKTDRAEKAARASDRRLAAIMSASADAILGLDAGGPHRVVESRRGIALRLSRPIEMRGQPFFHLFGRGEAAEVEFRWLSQNVTQNGYVRGHETTCHDAHGHAVAVELTATSLTDETHQPLGMSVILRDVTERKRRDEEIRRLNASLSDQVAERTRELAEKVDELARANAELQKLDQTRSEFVSLVSHQIRAPLTNLRGAAERMQTGLRRDDQHHVFADVRHHAAAGRSAGCAGARCVERGAARSRRVGAASRTDLGAARGAASRGADAGAENRSGFSLAAAPRPAAGAWPIAIGWPKSSRI